MHVWDVKQRVQYQLPLAAAAPHLNMLFNAGRTRPGSGARLALKGLLGCQKRQTLGKKAVTSVCSRSNAGGADNVIPSPDSVSNKNAIDPLLSQGGPGPRVSGNEIHIYNRGKGFVRKHLSPQ